MTTVALEPAADGPTLCPTCLGIGEVDTLERDPANPYGYLKRTLPCRTCGGVGSLAPASAK